MFNNLTVSAHYALIYDKIIRLDEIQEVYPYTTDEDHPGESSDVHFRNGKSTIVNLDREEILKLLVSKS